MSRRGRFLCGCFALVAFALLLLPLAVVISGSFDGSKSAYLRFPPTELSLRWYRDLPASYVHSFFRSLFISSSAAILATVTGIIAAVSLARSSIGNKEWLRIFFQLPIQIPFVVIGVMFLQLYYALYDYFDIRMMSTYGGLILAHLFFCVPYTVASVGSVITSELVNLENAARICGSTEKRVLRRVTIPALMPGVFSGLFYAFIISFGDIPVSIFLANTNIQPLPVQIFQTLQFDFDPSVLAASTLVVVFSVVLILFVQKVLGIELVQRGARN